jgi:type II secretion system protein N
MKGQSKILLWAGFFLYGLAVFSLLTFYRLPADEILAKVVEAVSHGQVSVSEQRMSASLWEGYRLEDLTWTIEAGDTLLTERMKSLSLSPSLLKVFLGYFSVDAKGDLAGGSIQLSAGLPFVHRAGNGYASLKTDGIRIEELAAANLLMQRQIKGKLRGEADIVGPLNDLRKLSGKGAVFVEEGSVETRLDFLGLKTIPFAKLALPFTLRNGVASVKDGQIAGPLLTGDLEGWIRLQSDFRVSPIEVTATIRPGPSFDNEQTGVAVMAKNRPWVVHLRGTLSKPLFSLAGGSPSP